MDNRMKEKIRDGRLTRDDVRRMIDWQLTLESEKIDSHLLGECLLFLYPYAPLEMLLTVLVLISYVLFSALFALFLGLMTANLTWTNEVTPIKQNVGVLFAMLSGFAYTVLLCAGFMLLDGWKLGFTGYMALFGGVTLVLCALLWLWLRKKGCSRFASL